MLPDRCRTLFVEGEANARRLIHCERCGIRLEVVSTLKPLSPSAIAVAELESIHLDFLCAAAVSSILLPREPNSV